jgi:hypothetical protein
MSKELNFTSLHNTGVQLDADSFPERACSYEDRLGILGVPDSWEGKPNLPAASASIGLSNDQEWILLSHQPALFPEARDMTPPVGLQLSGHVHAGQTFPLHPLVWIAQSGRFSGLYQEKDSFLYVTNGQSNWGPRVRLYSTPTSPVLTLRNAEAFKAAGGEVDLGWTRETWWAVLGLLILPIWVVGCLAIYVCVLSSLPAGMRRTLSLKSFHHQPPCPSPSSPSQHNIIRRMTIRSTTTSHVRRSHVRLTRGCNRIWIQI